MVRGRTLLIILLAVVLLALGFTLSALEGGSVRGSLPLSFKECVEGGYKVSPGPPRRCQTPEGLYFVEGKEVGETLVPPEPTGTSSPPVPMETFFDPGR